MNLYFRLIKMVICSRFRKQVEVFDDFVSHHRVLLNDLDPLGHMNNGRYLTISDYVRMEWLIRAGAWRRVRKRGFMPVVASETIQFRRSLLPFQKYTLTVRLLGWNDKFFYIEQSYESNGKSCALALVKARILGPKNSRISPKEFLEVGGVKDVPDEKMTPTIEQWNNYVTNHWEEHESRKES